MKTQTFNAKNRLSKQCRIAIENTIKTHNIYKGSYMWTGDNGNIAYRDRQEHTFYSENHKYKINLESETLEIEPQFSQSRSNTYYKLIIFRYIHGESILECTQVDVRALKRLLKKSTIKS